MNINIKNLTLDLILKSHKNMIEMLYDRGYDVNGENNMTIEEIKNKYKKIENFNKLKFKGKDEIYLHYVVLPEDIQTNKIGNTLIQNYILDSKKNNINHIILVVPTELSTQSIKIIEKIKYDFRIEIFNYKQLLVNITKNIYVPTYILLNEVEKQEFQKIYNLKTEDDLLKLPKISIYDPICKYYDFKPNDILKIIRKRPINGISNQIPTYRIVIDTNII